MKLVCVNGSGRTAKKYGLQVPLLTILSGYILNQTDKPAIVATRSALRGLVTEKLLVIERGAKNLDIESELSRLELNYDTLDTISHKQRADLLLSVTGIDCGRGAGVKKVSNGVFALCYLLAQQAQEVVIAGMSLDQAGGYSYRDGEFPRNHITPDRQILQHLRAQGAPFSSTEPEFISNLDGGNVCSEHR
ncbi:hypothetical protein N9H39_01940 [Gammaproteobacteria bacterium]|nr:hypothetical protein [Gammaproteobacteria bacterium]